MDYLTSLRQTAQRLRAEQEAAERLKPVISPVIDQIQALFAKHPPCVPFSLDAIRAQVAGRFGRPPQRGEVAAALRLLGYTTVRMHRNGYASRRYWLPQKRKVNHAPGLP